MVRQFKDEMARGMLSLGLRNLAPLIGISLIGGALLGFKAARQ